jgi:hypothetical protein
MPPPAAARKSRERIYGAAQLLDALVSACAGLKDQLQVLSILDGTAVCWPGVCTAHADLEALVALAGTHLRGSEQRQQQLEASAAKAQGSITQLTAQLRGARGLAVCLRAPALSLLPRHPHHHASLLRPL